MSTQEALYKSSFIQAMQLFRKKVTKLGFQPVSKEEIIQSIFEQELAMPKSRATVQNVVQKQFKLSYCGYTIWIHTAIVGRYRYAQKGSAWILILNKDGKKVFVREFYKDHPKWLLARLAAYAHLAKVICANKPSDHELTETKENYLEWVSTDGKKRFDWNLYISKLELPDRKIVCRKENARDYYFEKTRHLVETKKMRRERAIRKRWKNK